MDPNEIEGDSGGYVFVSYARDDERAARTIIELLERAGYQAWWDGLIPGGERFGAEIAKALEGARAVVVLWSANANESHWVQDEAGWARDRHKLVPLSLDGAKPPLGFRPLLPPGQRRPLPAVASSLGALCSRPLALHPTALPCCRSKI